MLNALALLSFQHQIDSNAACVCAKKYFPVLRKPLLCECWIHHNHLPKTNGWTRYAKCENHELSFLKGFRHKNDPTSHFTHIHTFTSKGPLTINRTSEKPFYWVTIVLIISIVEVWSVLDSSKNDTRRHCSVWCECKFVTSHQKFQEPFQPADYLNIHEY